MYSHLAINEFYRCPHEDILAYANFFNVEDCFVIVKDIFDY